jgi:2'-5' RNA ligase
MSSILEKTLFLNYNEGSVSEETKNEGVMIAFYPDKKILEKYLVEDGSSLDELHITLIYLGKRGEMGDAVDKLPGLVESFVNNPPRKKMKAQIGGLGRFNASPNSDGQDVLYASIDAPDLPEFRQDLVNFLEKEGIRIRKDHGYTPHMTLSYFPSESDMPIQRVDTSDIVLDKLVLEIGQQCLEYELKD